MPRSESGDPTVSLADHLAWLESIGSKPCSCRYAWKSLSYREHNRIQRMGYGWVRMNTDPRCPEHGSEVDATTSAKARGVAVDEWAPRAQTVEPDTRYL